MDEIADLRARSAFTPRTPADFADIRQDIGDRLLLSMMMPVRAPGLTSNNPPHNADWMPSCGATAARRTEPGVCAVPGSNAAGLTMRIGEYSDTMIGRLEKVYGHARSHPVARTLVSDPCCFARAKLLLS